MSRVKHNKKATVTCWVHHRLLYERDPQHFDVPSTYCIQINDNTDTKKFSTVKCKQACLSRSSENKNDLWHILNLEYHNEFFLFVKPSKKKKYSRRQFNVNPSFFDPTEMNSALSKQKEDNIEKSTQQFSPIARHKHYNWIT